eukprot:1094763-Pyramimonas_sp.AAC.1
MLLVAILIIIIIVVVITINVIIISFEAWRPALPRRPGHRPPGPWSAISARRPTGNPLDNPSAQRFCPTAWRTSARPRTSSHSRQHSGSGH